MALEAILKSPPDIIITDLDMPAMDGKQFTSEIRRNSICNETPVLMLTGRDDPHTLVTAIQAGVAAFISKATVRDVLSAQLFALVRLCELHKSLSRVKQLDAVKSLVGTYKYEFGNTLAIIDGKVRKLEKEVPRLADHQAFTKIKLNLVRFLETLRIGPGSGRAVQLKRT